MKSAEFLYRPQHKNRDELINDFVIRNSIYDRILHSITTEEVSEPSQHILIEGKRGMGKTTLMLRLTYELENDKKLKKQFVPCKFNEEEFGIANLAILWERIAEHLEEDKRFVGITDIFDDIEGHDTEERFIEEILKWLEEQKVIAVIFIDNFFQIIEKFNEREQQRLREVLIKTPYLKIVAGSARFLEKNAGDYSAPFFEFFKREKLNKLNKKETRELLVHLAEKHKADNVIDTINNEPQRIDNIRILCGGVPRTLVTFFEVLLDDNNGNSIDDLKMVMDRTNELYLQRMNSLSKKEQPIIHEMALHWEAISTGNLAEKVKEKSGALSAVLNKLAKQQIIEKVKTDTKNHLWRIEERFFNIWYLMTQAPRRYQKKIKWLTAFIEALYCKEDFSFRLKTHLTQLDEAQVNPEYAYVLAQAFCNVTLITIEEREELIRKTRDFVGNEEFSQYSDLPLSGSELRNRVLDHLADSNFTQAKKVVDELPYEDLKGLHFDLIESFERFPVGPNKEDLSRAFDQRVRDAFFIALAFEKASTDNLEVDISILSGELRTILDKSHRRLEIVLSIVLRDLPVSWLIALVKALDSLKVFYLAEGALLLLADSDTPLAYSLLGILYGDLKEYEKAAQYFKLTLDAGVSIGFYGLLSTYESLKDFKSMRMLIESNYSLVEDRPRYIRVEQFSKLIVLVHLFMNEEEIALKKAHEFLLIDDSSVFDQQIDLLNILIAKGFQSYLMEIFEGEEDIRRIFEPYYYWMGSNFGDLQKMRLAPPELEEIFKLIDEKIIYWEKVFDDLA